MIPGHRSRGQAAVEGLAIWVVVAAVAGITAAVIAASGLPSSIAGELSSAFTGTPATVDKTLIDRALVPGGPSLLLARTQLRHAVGDVRAEALIRSAVEQAVRASRRQEGPLDVTRLVGGQNPNIRLIATATGPLRLIALTADEPLPKPNGISVGPSTIVGGAIAAARKASTHERVVEVVGHALRRGVAWAGHGWSAVGLVSDTIVTDAGLAPGARAGDATLCRSVDIRWVAFGQPYRQATAQGHELVILRNGDVIARYVPTVEGPC